jgi:quercetin dioxygenase-like cupin family protein
MDRPEGDLMPESTILVNEGRYPWDANPPAPGCSAEVRWRTLISGDRTPTKGLSMGVCEVPPGAELAPHHHHPQEAYYVTSGEGEVYIDAEWRPLRCGDVAYFPGDAVHGIRNRGTQTCVVVWAFPTDTFDEIEYHDD